MQLEHEIDLLEQQEQQQENLQNSTLIDYQATDNYGDKMQQLFHQLDVHPIHQDTTDAQNSSVYRLNQDIRKAEICLVNSELENQISNNLINLTNNDNKSHLNNCSNDPSVHSSGDELSINSSCDLQSYVRSTDLNNLQMSRSYSSISAGSTTENSQVVVSQLDQKVMSIAKNFYGKKAKTGIQRIAEGKYKIAHKIVFIRVSVYFQFKITCCILRLKQVASNRGAIILQVFNMKFFFWRFYFLFEVQILNFIMIITERTPF